MYVIPLFRSRTVFSQQDYAKEKNNKFIISNTIQRVPKYVQCMFYVGILYKLFVYI